MRGKLPFKDKHLANLLYQKWHGNLHLRDEMTLPSKAAMEIAEAWFLRLQKSPIGGNKSDLASLIDSHPLVKALLDGATDDDYHNGDLLEAPKCSICQAVTAWQPQTEKEDG